MNSSVELVKFKKTLKGFHLEKSLKLYVREKILSIPDYIGLKIDTELTSFACNLIENGIIKKGKLNKIDKKVLVIDILTEIFGLKPTEQDIVKNQIEYLHSNNKIKKLALVDVAVGMSWSWIKRKVL